MPIENKPHRASSRALAHLDGLLDEALEQTFPASDAIAIDFERESHDREHEFSIPALRSLATGRWARELHINTRRTHQRSSAYLAAEMRTKLTVALMHAATFGPASRLFKV